MERVLLDVCAWSVGIFVLLFCVGVLSCELDPYRECPCCQKRGRTYRSQRGMRMLNCSCGYHGFADPNDWC